MDRAALVAEKVREMDEAAYHARSWTQPGSCGVGNEMPCQHPNCIERAATYSEYWTQLAARCAITLESLLTAEPERPQPFPTDWAESVNAARGLCESEANRWERTSPKTSEHWRRVAVHLGGIYLTQDHIGLVAEPERPTQRLSARWQELFWALPPGEMRHKLRSLEIDTGRALRGAEPERRAPEGQ